MEKINKKVTIIKYGSDTLVSKNVEGKISIDFNNICNHGLLIDKIDNPVIIVSSGAVAFGKTFDKDFDYVKDEIIKRRIFAAIGNPHLSINWDKSIPNKLVLQSLITHRDLISKDSREKIAEVIAFLYKKDDAIIQVNDNDFVTDEELRSIRNGDFGDNDEITSLLAKLCADLFDEVEVIINTSSDGILVDDKIIPLLKARDLTDGYIDKICGLNKSEMGFGGMSNKLKIFRDLILGSSISEVHIINGKNPEHLMSLLDGKNVGTKIK